MSVGGPGTQEVKILERFNFRRSTYMGYVGIDCPSCGRARLQLFVRVMRQRKYDERMEPTEPPTFALKCDKCDAIEWTCDPDAHSVGGPHPEPATAYYLDGDCERELDEELGPNGLMMTRAERQEAGLASRERAASEIDEDRAQHERRVLTIMEEHERRLRNLGLTTDAAEERRQIKERAGDTGRDPA